jgi:protein phosphatase 1G
VSRSFGDFLYKQVNAEELGLPEIEGPLVSIEPEIRQIFLAPNEDEFILIACDGLFDVISSQEVVDIIRERLMSMPITE